MPHHLRKHPVTGHYYFRQAVPRALRDAVGKAELLLNLNTKDSTEARLRSYILSAQTIIRFRELKKMKGRKEPDFDSMWSFTVAIESNKDGVKISGEADPDKPGDVEALNKTLMQLSSQDMFPKSGGPTEKVESASGISAESDQVPAPFRKIKIADAIVAYSASVRSKTFPKHRAPKLREFGDWIEREQKRQYVYDITKEDVDAFVIWLHKAKPNIKAGQGMGLSNKTINTYVDVMSRFFSWCQGRDYYRWGSQLNPFYKKRTRADDPTQDRERFTAEELKVIFDPLIFRAWSKDMPHHFWIPLLGLYTGARLSEICELRTDNFAQDPVTNVYLIRFSGQKNRASKRSIPMHHRLIQLGLLDYLQDLKNQFNGNCVLFPWLRNPSKRAGDAFAQYLDKRGITSSKKVFHSFRHTVVQTLEEAHLPSGFSRRYVGHAADDVHAVIYQAEELPLVQMEKTLKLMDFDIDVESIKYKKGMFDAFLRRKAFQMTRKKENKSGVAEG